MEILQAIVENEELLRSITTCIILVIGFGVFVGLAMFQSFNALLNIANLISEKIDLILGKLKKKKGVVVVDPEIKQ